MRERRGGSSGKEERGRRKGRGSEKGRGERGSRRRRREREREREKDDIIHQMHAVHAHVYIPHLWETL